MHPLGAGLSIIWKSRRRTRPRGLAPGRRARLLESVERGRYLTGRLPRGRPRSLALDASLRAAARQGRTRLLVGDIREKHCEPRGRNLICVLLDASGSMGVRRRAELAKGLAASLLAEGRRFRDQLALLSFRGTGCRCCYGPGRDLGRVTEILSHLPSGGKTPLGHAIGQALDFLTTQSRRFSSRPVLVVISDGGGNLAVRDDDPYREAIIRARRVARSGVAAVFIDTEDDARAYGYGRQLARAMKAEYLILEAARRRGVLEICT